MVTEELDFALSLEITSGSTVRERAAATRPEAEVSFEAWVDPDGRDYGHCFQQDGEYHVHIYGIGSFVFAEHSRVVRGAPAPEMPPEAFREAFYREIVPLVLQHQSWEVLHASGLVMEGVCVALSGSSQAGKSTLAHAWHRRGGQVYADDVIPFRMDDGKARIRPVPFRIRLRPPSLRYFEACTPDAGQPLTHAKRQIEGRDDLGSIYLLDQRRDEASGDVTLEPVAAALAFPALLRQAFCLTLRERRRTRDMMEQYIALAESVPIFRLSYPIGLGHVDTVIDHLRAHVASRRGE